MQDGDGYERARELYDVVTGLCDSFADDAFVRDKESGVYFDLEEMHTPNHKGDDLEVKGPLNVARPVQGWPVIIQAGQPEPGRQLAAETAEVVFCSPRDLKSAKALYSDIKERAVTVDRDRNHINILPAALIIIGNTFEDAQAKRPKLDSSVHYDSGISSLPAALSADAS